jgi:hypothetical protein
MTQSPFFVVVAIVTAVFGLGFLFAADAVFAWYGVADVTDATRLTGRYFGGALIGFAIIYTMARDLGAGSSLTGLLWSGLVFNVVGLVLAIMATTAGTINATGWVSVVIHIVLGLGFVYFLFLKPSTATA